MIILALDTSTRTGSSAVLRGDDVLADVAGDVARTHAERLPADLMQALDGAHLALGDVDVFAVATGPGSFTGLRVGIATMQGLALAAGRPLVGVSVLDALAHAAAIVDGDVRVATWVDAWRGEVYAALYDGVREVEAASVELPGAILPRLRGTRTVFVGDGAAVHRDAIRFAMGPSDGVLPPILEPPLAGVIARLARAEIERGHQPGPADIQPIYVRRPDAELARDARVQR
jgi:tRNA threonylcarbamoyladenosine biosynthesis protein TsaB